MQASPSQGTLSLYVINLEWRLPQLLHKAEVGIRKGFGMPRTDTEVLHGQLGHPMHLHLLLHLITEERRTLEIRKL